VEKLRIRTTLGQTKTDSRFTDDATLEPLLVDAARDRASPLPGMHEELEDMTKRPNDEGQFARDGDDLNAL
jgi:hypothetical protein